MTLALEVELKTIAFPAISSGVYRFPMPRANKIATGTVAGILREYSPEGCPVVGLMAG